MKYYSAIKEEWNTALCSKMDGPRDYHTKWSHTKTKLYGITYMWNLKNNTKELIYKTETDIENS